MKNILVAVDFSDVTERLIAKSCELARLTGAKLWVLHAVTDTSFISGAGEIPIPWTVSDDELPRHFPSERGKLDELTAGVRKQGIVAQAMLVSGPAVERVLGAAEKTDADMIVLGSHGHTSLYKLLVGTISEGVLRKAHRPVLIVPSQSGKPHGHVRERKATGPAMKPD